MPTVCGLTTRSTLTYHGNGIGALVLELQTGSCSIERKASKHGPPSMKRGRRIRDDDS